MLTQDQLNQVVNNYLEARQSLHPAHNWDLSMAKNAIIEVLAILGVEKPVVDMAEYGNGEIKIDLCKVLNANPNLYDALLPLFEGIYHRTGEVQYGYKNTFYGRMGGWFYVSSWISLHNQILGWKSS